MKKILSLLMIGAIVFANATFAFAGATGTVNIAITINHSKSIEIGGNADLSINLGQTAVSATAITVKNNGTGINETVTLTASVPAGWTMQFQFADAQPDAGDANWKTAADISEVIAYNVTKKLWIKLIAPATTTEISLTIPVNMTAN